MGLIWRGGFESSCAIGYQGPLCGSCIDGYAKVGTDCVKCNSATANFLQIFALFALLFVCVMIMILYVYHKILITKWFKNQSEGFRKNFGFWGGGFTEAKHADQSKSKEEKFFQFEEGIFHLHQDPSELHSNDRNHSFNGFKMALLCW